MNDKEFFYVKIWGNSVLIRGNKKCKGFEVGVRVVCLINRKVSVVDV